MGTTRNSPRSGTALIERRSTVQQAIALNKRIRGLRRGLDEPTPAPPEKQVVEPGSSSVNHYISKSVLRDFSNTVGKILGEWHFPGATDVYVDEKERDVVIGGRPRGSRGAGLCAITYSAFTLALFEYCCTRKMPHPGLVILDSPLIAYKEPKADDEGIIGTDLKLRFYDHLLTFAGNEQIFIVDNTDPPEHFLDRAIQFTGIPPFPAAAYSRACRKLLNNGGNQNPPFGFTTLQNGAFGALSWRSVRSRATAMQSRCALGREHLLPICRFADWLTRNETSPEEIRPVS